MENKKIKLKRKLTLTIEDGNKKVKKEIKKG
jgi:hypothetical protein